jgi:hypothetical protein
MGRLLELVLSVFERKVAPAELDAGMREVGRHVAALHAGKVKEKSWSSGSRRRSRFCKNSAVRPHSRRVKASISFAGMVAQWQQQLPGTLPPA